LRRKGAGILRFAELCRANDGARYRATVTVVAGRRASRAAIALQPVGNQDPDNQQWLFDAGVWQSAP
jgi:hypothetical protein